MISVSIIPSKRVTCPFLAHHDRPPFSGRPSLTEHCGHGWTSSLLRPVASDPYQAFHVGTAVDLRRAPYLSASKGQGNP